MQRIHKALLLFLSLAGSQSAVAEPAIVMSYDMAAAQELMDVFPSDGSGFTNKQITVDGNEINVVRDPTFQQPVLEFRARPRKGNRVSKSSVLHEGFAAREGSVFILEMDIKVIGDRIGGIFLADLECTDCWPSRSMISNKSPGIRLYIDRSGGFLAVDRGKIGMRGANLRSRGRPPRFPANQWVNLVWRVEVSHSRDALTQAFVDGEPYLEARGATLVDGSKFRKYGISLRKEEYNYLELGITANESPGDAIVRVRAVEIRLE